MNNDKKEIIRGQISEYSISISGYEIKDSTEINEIMLISGPADRITLEMTKEISGHYTLPDISDTFSGILYMEDKTSIHLRSIPEDEARKLILDYITENPGALTSEIVCDLELEPPLVLKILRSLKDTDLVESREIIV